MSKGVEKSEFTVAAVHRSIRTFRDLANDLLRANFEMFGDGLRNLANFCKTDLVFSKIHEQLATHSDVDVNKWVQEHGDIRLDGFHFPVDADERLALQYQLVIAGAENPEGLIHRAVMWFSRPHGNISTYVHEFADAIMRPLFRDLSYRLDDVEESLPEAKTEAVNASALRVVHIKTESVIMQKNEFTNSKNIQIGNENVQDNREINLNITLQELAEQIDSADVSPKVKQEAKSRFQKLLEHPLVCSIVGGATSALLTPRT